MSAIGNLTRGHGGIISGGTLQDPKKGLINFFGGFPTDSGVPVNHRTALKLSAVYSAVRVLSESIAVLPLNILQQVGDSREIARAHPLFNLLHSEPNNLMTSYDLRETMMFHVVLWGNAYARITFDAMGRATSIMPIEPWRVKVKHNKSLGILEYTIDNQTVFDQAEILHIKGLSSNGLVGKSVIEHASQDFGLALAAQTFASKFFGNGMNLGGWIESEKGIGDPAFKRLQEQLKDFKGPLNSHGTPIFDNGQVFKPHTIKAKDTMMIEVRSFEIQEVSRWFRIPQHLLQNLDKATFSNIEHQDLQFVKYTLLSWVKKFEQELNRKLLREDEKSTTTFKFNMDIFLRADTKTRFEAHQKGILAGWLTRDEARRIENMNPIKDLNKPLIPLNMGVLEADGTVTALAKQDNTTENRSQDPENPDDE